MGVIYYVACRDCKVVRDLDKFYAFRTAETKPEVISVADDIEKTHSFRAALLTSFMASHRGHNCTAYSENDDDMNEETKEFAEDHDYWTDDA